MLEFFIEMGRGLAMSFFMIYGAFCLSIVLFPSVFFLAIPSRRIIVCRRIYVTTLCGIFIDFLYFLTETLSGTKVHVYCDDPTILNDQSGVIILSNHRTRTDWLYVGLSYSSFISVMSNMVIILKDALRTAPIFGWLMQLALYIFLQRNRESDIPHISKMLAYLTSLGSIPSLLLFPEGTDLSESNIEKSNRFATENNLPHYRQVLHPKPSGLVTAVNCFREGGEGRVIHDITIAYEDYDFGIRSSEKSFFFGKFPRAVHLCVQRIPLDKFPKEKREIEQWLRQSFDRKEALLTSFYSPPTDSSTLHSFRRRHMANTWPKEITLPRSRQSSRLRSVILMGLLMLTLSFLLYVSPFSRWIVAGVIIAFVSSAHIFRGFDNLELLLHSRQIIPNHSVATERDKDKEKKG